MEAVANACDALFDSVRGRIWVGFSGGMDSTALLHALVRSARRQRGGLERLVAVHVDHGLVPADDHG